MRRFRCGGPGRRRRHRASLHNALPGATLAAVALLLAVLAAPAGLAATGPWQENEQSRVRLVTPWERAPMEGPWTVGLEFETEPGWHVYWKNSGDAGYPPAIDFSPTPAATASELLWPAPERYELPGDLVAFGYEEHVVYPVRVSLDPAILEQLPRDGDGPLRLTADLDYLVCEVECIPYSYRLEVEQPLARDGEPLPDPPAAAEIDRWLARVPRAAGEVAGLETEGVLDLADPEQPALLVRFGGIDETTAEGEPDLFLEVSDTFDAGRPERLEAPEGEMRFRVPLAFRVRPEALPAEARFAWTLAWPPRDGAVPADGEAASGTAAAEEAGMLPVEARRTAPVRTDGGGFDGPATTTSAEGAGGNRPGLAAGLLWAFLGGLLLHLTPGVLPLTVARLAELPGANPRRGALLTAGGVLGAAVAVLPLAAVAQGGGRVVTWGAQFQEPVPVALLALASTLVALNLWGFLRLPLRPAADGATADGSGARGVLVGLAVVVLGLAWNLPPLARSLGPALAPEAAAFPALLVLLALALGLALPFLAAAAKPEHLARLVPSGPDAADRRARLAEALAFVELGAVLWLLYLLSRQVAGEGLAFVQLALLGVALAAWWRHVAGRRTTRAVAWILLLALAVTSVWLADTYRLGAVPDGILEVPGAEEDAAAGDVGEGHPTAS